MNDVSALVPRYDLLVALASLAIATLASFTALDLAKRVRSRDRRVAFSWWFAGSLAMGTGIWSMHFVGMLAFDLPIALGYTKLLTVVSWCAAVFVSSVALAIAGSRASTLPGLTLGALVMGAGICAMHYLGMAAIELAPGIVWNVWLVAASALIAVGASGAALAIFVRMRRLDGRAARRYQFVAALVMGIAICGMHFTGMAAASFPVGAVCLSAASLSGDNLGMLVALATAGLLGLTLAVSLLDSHLQGKTLRLAKSLRVANMQLQAANAELQKRALLDPLTDLPNRVLFEDRLAHALTRHGRADQRSGHRHTRKLAVMFIDLDGFKPVNDSLGHAAGDLVLKETARRLQAAARETDTVARVGGDEFVLLMENVLNMADCVRLAGRLVRALGEPFEVAGRVVQVSGSIGVAVYPDQANKAKLIANADAAMYAAKRAGGNNFTMFEERMDLGVTEQLSLQNDLRHALERGQMELFYQPKVDARRGQINGVEALLRWNHPDRGMVSPVEFIPMAERFGLINGLGNWVIEEACRQMHEWAEDGVRMRVAINLSVHQLREEDLVSRIEQALLRHRVEASQLLCEITESVAMEDIGATHRAFDGLGRIGVFLSIDDFGTGYSSLSYLRQLPASQLKIDRSFINDLETSSDARAVVDAVVRLAHALSLKVVAEGVETEGQRDILRQLGCDELQGFFFARPMSAASLLAWTHGNKPAGKPDFTPSVMHEAV